MSDAAIKLLMARCGYSRIQAAEIVRTMNGDERQICESDPRAALDARADRLKCVEDTVEPDVPEPEVESEPEDETPTKAEPSHDSDAT